MFGAAIGILAAFFLFDHRTREVRLPALETKTPSIKPI
jgi:hypothetical protein